MDNRVTSEELEIAVSLHRELESLIYNYGLAQYNRTLAMKQLDDETEIMEGLIDAQKTKFTEFVDLIRNKYNMTAGSIDLSTGEIILPKMVPDEQTLET